MCLQVELAAEKAQDQLSQANEELRVDMEKWHEAKNKEVCQFMRQFASNHVDYHQKVYTVPDPVTLTRHHLSGFKMVVFVSADVDVAPAIVLRISHIKWT